VQLVRHQLVVRRPHLAQRAQHVLLVVNWIGIQLAGGQSDIMSFIQNWAARYSIYSDARNSI
jgi:hypothetical protein